MAEFEYDLQGAREAGVPEAEIQKYIASRAGINYDFDSAKKFYSDRGLSENEADLRITAYLYSKAKGVEVTMPETTLRPGEPAYLYHLGKMEKFIKDPKVMIPTALSTVAAATGAGVPTIIAGGVAGGALAEGIDIAGEAVRGEDTGTIPQRLKRVGLEAAKQGAFEAGGEVVGRLVSKLGAPFADAITPELRELAEAYKRGGGVFSPEQMTSSKTLDIVVGGLEKTIFGAPAFRTFREGQDKAIEANAELLAKQFGGRIDPDVAGVMVLDAIRDQSKLYKEAANKLYKRAFKFFPKMADDKLGRIIADVNAGKPIPAGLVDIRPLKKYAISQSQAAERFGRLGASEYGDTLYKRTADIPDLMSFEDAHELRSRIMKDKDKLNITKDPAMASASRMIKLVDEQMESAASKLSGKALAEWRYANEFYKGKYIKRFRNKWTEAILKRGADNPEFVGRHIFKNRAVSNINRLRQIVDNQTFDRIRAGWLSELLDAARDPSTGTVSGRGILSNLNRFGEKAGRVLMGDGKYNAVKTFGRIVEEQQKRGNAMLFQLMQGGIAAGIAASIVYGEPGTALTGIGVFMSPYAFSKALLSPAGRRYLTDGLINISKASAAQQAKIVFRMADFLVREGETVEVNGKKISAIEELNKIKGEVTSGGEQEK